MVNFSSLLLVSKAFVITFFVVDILLLLGAIGILVYVLVKMSKKSSSSTKGFRKIDDDTYVVNSGRANKNQPQSDVANHISTVEHFSNQMERLNEEKNEEVAGTVRKNLDETSPLERSVKQESKSITATLNEAKGTRPNTNGTTIVNSNEFFDRLKTASENEQKPNSRRRASTTVVVRNSKTTKSDADKK